MALCQICVYANSASNPLIYSAVNEHFREGFKNYFRSWIDCVLKIKGSRRKDKMRTNKRRTKAKPVGGCSFCGQSDTSLDGTLCNGTNNSSQANTNSDQSGMLQRETASMTTAQHSGEFDEFLTTV